jgi:hypothetical protein
MFSLLLWGILGNIARFFLEAWVQTTNQKEVNKGGDGYWSGIQLVLGVSLGSMPEMTGKLHRRPIRRQTTMVSGLSLGGNGKDVLDDSLGSMPEMTGILWTFLEAWVQGTNQKG